MQEYPCGIIRIKNIIIMNSVRTPDDMVNKDCLFTAANGTKIYSQRCQDIQCDTYRQCYNVFLRGTTDNDNDNCASICCKTEDEAKAMATAVSAALMEFDEFCRQRRQKAELLEVLEAAKKIQSYCSVIECTQCILKGCCNRDPVQWGPFIRKQEEELNREGDLK